MAQKNCSEYQAPCQSTLNSHIPKGVWVVLKDYRWQGALCFLPDLKHKNNLITENFNIWTF